MSRILFLFCQGLIIWLLTLSPTLNLGKPPVEKYILSGKAQGTTYRIIYYTSGDTLTSAVVDSLLDHMNDCFSLYQENSLINQFNSSSRGVVVDQDFKKVLEQCFAVHQDTKGLADPTIYPLVLFWAEAGAHDKGIGFRNQLKLARSCVGLGGVSIFGDSLVKNKPCLQLDLNGSAQGYTVDYIAQCIEQRNINDYLVELGGEIRVKGRKQPGGGKFAVAVEQPGDGLGATSFNYKNYYLEEGAVTTSGNYRKYMESGGNSLGHIIDPKKGYPFQNELISVTLFAKTALIADAYDHAVFGMGLKRGWKFIEAHPFLKAVFVYRDKSGKIRVQASAGLNG
jgi:thiamine biosynthesis lipoprotein